MWTSGLFFPGGGLPRLSLWLGNPNKAAVLLGCLALVFMVVAFRVRRRGVSWVCGVLSAVCWCGLLLTFSRGGLAAFAIGLLIVLWSFRRQLPRLLLLALLLVGTALVAFVFGNRGKGFALTDDTSVANRLEIWREVPRMMADTWTGWGVGNAGDAYMGWYQPLQSHERYRTLVSSHLTWLVEFGFWGRMAYCAGWLLMLGLCLRRWRQKGDPLPLSCWLSFFIAGVFSSVAESPVLWLVPAIAAVPAVWDFVRNLGRRDCQVLLASAVVLGALLPLGLMWAGSGRTEGKIFLRGDELIYGRGRPTTWIVRDLSVMGGAAYGRALRHYAQQATNVTCGIAAERANVPADVRRLVLCGKAADAGAERLATFGALEEIRVLSPKRPKDWLAVTSSVPIAVFCGEFAPMCPAKGSARLKVVPGNGIYLTKWPQCALSSANEGIPVVDFGR